MVYYQCESRVEKSFANSESPESAKSIFENGSFRGKQINKAGQ